MSAPESSHLVIIDWSVAPFRAERWYGLWLPAAERALSYGATHWTITRSTENPLLFRQSIGWRERSDFERYWASDELDAARRQTSGLHAVPVLPVWHTLLAGETIAADGEPVAEAGAAANGG